MIGQNIIANCMNWFQTGKLSLDLNDTNIVLIHKESSSSITNLRLIPLCNVIYKIFFKFLTNRLRKYLSDIILECQSAFIPRRSMADNILLAFEIIHYMKIKNKRKKVEVSMKIGISKAYDRVI